MELVEILQNMVLFIVVTFLVTEFLKKVVKAITEPPGWCFFVLSIALGVAFSYGWGLSVLPAPVLEGFSHLNAVVTGVIIGAAASGVFSGLDEIFPGLNL